MNSGGITTCSVKGNVAHTISEQNLDTSIVIQFDMGVHELGCACGTFKPGLGFVRSWNVMIGGHVKYEELQMAHQLFYEMPDRNVTS